MNLCIILQERQLVTCISFIINLLKDIWDICQGKWATRHCTLIKVCTKEVNVFYSNHISLLFLQVDFADTSVVITEPYFNFTSIQESMNEILFEEYQFQAALRVNGGLASPTEDALHT